MGYYFDYHQWCEERNKAPDSKARPDASKKKKKKLNLKFMNWAFYFNDLNISKKIELFFIKIIKFPRNYNIFLPHINYGKTTNNRSKEVKRHNC
jgi:hypothetical protein